MQIKSIAMPLIEAGPRRGVAASVVKTAQFLVEIAGRYWSTDVKFERRREDARRYGPVTTLEFPGYDPVEVHDPDRNSSGECDACNKQWKTPTRRPGAG